MSSSKTTHDHKEIQNWVESRGGVPSIVKGTAQSNNDGILRIHFPDNSEGGDQLEKITWDRFFNIFDQNKLDFIYQDKKADGETSTFHKFVDKDQPSSYS